MPVHEMLCVDENAAIDGLARLGDVEGVYGDETGENDTRYHSAALSTSTLLPLQHIHY